MSRIALGEFEDLGDISGLEDPMVVERLVERTARRDERDLDGRHVHAVEAALGQGLQHFQAFDLAPALGGVGKFRGDEQQFLHDVSFHWKKSG